MPATFFIFIILIVLTAFSVLYAVVFLLTFLVKKIFRKENPTPRWMILPLLLFFIIGIFFVSLLIFDGIVSQVTDSNMVFSDYDKTAVNENYEIEGCAQFELCSRKTGEKIIDIDSLCVDGEDIIASNRTYKGQSVTYRLYNVSPKGNGNSIEEIDSSFQAGAIWNHYVQAHNIDRSEVHGCYELCSENNQWNPLIVFLLTLITTFTSGYYLHRWYESKPE